MRSLRAAARVRTGLALLLGLALVGSVLQVGAGRAGASPSRADASASDEAWGWVMGQLGTGTPVTTGSTILPGQDYAPSWTGPVAGTVVLRDVAPVTSAPDPAPLELDGGEPGPGAGVVTGRVLLAPQSGRWVVDVVRTTAQGEVSAHLQAAVAADGTFSVDLARAVAGQGGWGFRVLDAHAGWAQTGPTWPQAALLEDLEVHALVVTDTTYLVDRAPARADGTFSFASSRPGAKLFRVVRVSSGAVLAESAPQTGLVRSFEVPAGGPLHGRTFTYDQALALLTAVSLERPEDAALLAQGLLRLQSADGPQRGGFVVSAAALNPDGAPAEYRTGIHAIATYALLRHQSTLATDDPLRGPVRDAADQGVTWLLAQEATSGPLAGLPTGGHGVRDGAGHLDPGAVVPWVSTEHAVDAWHTLVLADQALGHPTARAAADRLETAVLDRLWDPGTGRFLQGRTPEGPDPTPALDVGSWGALFLQAAGHPTLAASALASTADLATSDPPVSGYAPHRSDTGDLVWTEGTAGVALAQLRLGREDQARATMTALAPARPGRGAWPGATREDPALSMTTAPAVGATTWVLLVAQALRGRPTLWDDTTLRGAPRP